MNGESSAVVVVATTTTTTNDNPEYLINLPTKRNSKNFDESLMQTNGNKRLRQNIICRTNKNNNNIITGEGKAVGIYETNFTKSLVVCKSRNNNNKTQTTRGCGKVSNNVSVCSQTCVSGVDTNLCMIPLEALLLANNSLVAEHLKAFAQIASQVHQKDIRLRAAINL
eukprot:GHVS01008736.1.p1 GENE.GHVS01008736.1~~GHVS01008736.1.p1  ORF type:complete len:168 (+),score=40.13 GHVS01008736.1:352-855(+)